MKLRIITLISIILILTFTGCEIEGVRKPETSDSIRNRQTQQAMAEAARQTAYPAIKNFQEQKLMKNILELRDREDLVCHAYLVNRMTGEIGQYLGKCIGYGLPYSVQFTNPLRIWDAEKEPGARQKFEDNGEIQLMPQPEPNGLFMPEGLSATWLMLVDPVTNEPRPVYVEPEIIVSPFPLHDTSRVEVITSGGGGPGGPVDNSVQDAGFTVIEE